MTNAKRKVSIIAGSSLQAWQRTFGAKYCCELDWGRDPAVLANSDLIVFTGGADVNPRMYGSPRHVLTNFSDFRDDHDKAVYEIAKINKIPMVGVCRGSQFLTVMQGGSLIQHVTGHLGTHFMHTSKGKAFLVTSTHHQMMYPSERGEVIGWAKGLSQQYETGLHKDNEVFRKDMTDDEGVVREPEVVRYPDQVLCVQYHPEYMTFAETDQPPPAVSYFREQVDLLFE